MCQENCDCHKLKRYATQANGGVRYEVYDGRPHIVVPVIMARCDVVMNGGLITEDQLEPYAWNGVPVTVGHPRARTGEQTQANDPKVLDEWAVGRIFKAHVSDGALKAEAWVDIAKANRVHPTLIKKLKSQTKMDVSTGYFCDSEPASGSMNGKEYHEFHRNLRPEHLALLPDEEGACNFEDGCGVRENQRGPKTMSKLQKAIAGLLGSVKAVENAAKNEKTEDEEKAEIMSSLMANADSPFDDEKDFEGMSLASLRKMAKKLGKKNKKNEDDEEKEFPFNEDEDEEEEKPVAAKKRKNSVSETDLVAVVNSLKEIVAKSGLSDEDRALLKSLKANRDSGRSEKVSVVANSLGLPEKKVATFDDETLDAMYANASAPAPSYAARAVPKANDGESKEDAIVRDFKSNHGDSAVIHRLNAARKA